ncbi:MAG: outer rane efflux protein [Clostridia bacterium]|jgi:hypothetical protein|nr:outer rane efflux protein [Clostridia bacterium]
MKKEIITGMCILAISFNLNVYAESVGNNVNTVTASTTPSNLIISTAPAELTLTTTPAGLTLTIDEAVEQGLKNNIALSKVKNQSDLAKLINNNAEKNKNDIYNNQLKLDIAQSDISAARTAVYSSMTELDDAQSWFDRGYTPKEIVVPGIGAIPAHTPLSGLPPAVKEGIQNELNASRAKLEDGLEDFNAGTEEYVASKSKFDLAMQFAMTNVASKLSTSTISSLEEKHLADLIDQMADIQDRVTSYSVSIYKNKIALLIQNSYYEALKQQKLLAAKEKTMQRAKEQYEYAQFAYEVGAKSKDDRNFAKLYYDGAVMTYELQVKDYNNALIELRKNMNIPLDKQIILVEKEANYTSTLNLIQGINNGMRTRLEMKMADAQVELYKDLRAAVVGSYYDEDDNQYKEAQLLLDKAEIEAADAKLQVESSIRTSYETLITMQKVLAASAELKKNAEEAVEIARLKYEVGFGASSSLLKNLNLEDLSGTMVEVIAAEENLQVVEGKVIEATNGYNLAKAKYLNDIGVLPYK